MGHTLQKYNRLAYGRLFVEKRDLTAFLKAAWRRSQARRPTDRHDRGESGRKLDSLRYRSWSELFASTYLIGA